MMIVVGKLQCLKLCLKKIEKEKEMKNLEEALEYIKNIRSIIGETEYSKELMQVYQLVNKVENEITEYINKNKLREECRKLKKLKKKQDSFLEDDRNREQINGYGIMEPIYERW